MISEVAVQYLRVGGRIVLTAGDQRVGSLEISIERAQKRANAVRDVLVAKGVPRARVFTRPCGFAFYLVDTPPEIGEPMNRFVSIDLAPEDAILVDGSRDGCARDRGQNP